MTTFWFSMNPVSANPRRNAATRCALSSGERALRNPITGIGGCCARAASGHTAAPPISVMNARLLPRNSIRKRFGINDLPVSSILVRGAHGNSFDHLSSGREQCRRDFEIERFGGCQVDDEIKFGCQLYRHVGRPLSFENPPGVG